MARRQPPEGYITSHDAAERIGVSDGMLSLYVKQGKLQRYGPETRKYKFYKVSEVEALAQSENAFFEKGRIIPREVDAVFSPATHADMDALYAMAVKLFPHTASAEHRRSWLTKEPRGHYVVKRKSDGAVVAYLYLLALQHDLIVRYMHGEVRNIHITSEDVLNFVPGVPVEIILGGIASDPDVVEEDTRAGYVAVLLRGVRKDLERLGHEGITITRMYAYSETESGIAMCARLGMSQWEEPRGKRCTFQMDIASSNASIMRTYNHALTQWYTAHQGNVPQRENATRRIVTPSKNQGRSTITTDALNAHPENVPPDAIPLYQFARENGLDRRKMLDHLLRNNQEHIAVPIAARPGQYERYLTPEQQAAILAYWQQKRTP